MSAPGPAPAARSSPAHIILFADQQHARSFLDSSGLSKRPIGSPVMGIHRFASSNPSEPATEFFTNLAAMATTLSNEEISELSGEGARVFANEKCELPPFRIDDFSASASNTTGPITSSEGESWSWALEMIGL